MHNLKLQQTRQLESSLQGKTTSASSSMQSNNNKKGPTDESIVRKLMLDSWNESIFSDIKHRLQESAMKLVHAERNGEAFDSQLVIGKLQEKLVLFRYLDTFDRIFLLITTIFSHFRAGTFASELIYSEVKVELRVSITTCLFL